MARTAILVAAAKYDDPRFRELRALAHDAQALATVLGDPAIGGFAVDTVLDETEAVVRRRLGTFLRERRSDDLVVIHLSCHGIKDEDGSLYYVARDSIFGHLDSTAISADWLNRGITRCAARRTVVLLDCCHSGAFARGMMPRSVPALDLKERFQGSGRAVLTASSAMEYAFEGHDRAGEGEPSVFTSAIVDGLRTGDADRDGDGQISVDDLYAYVLDRVRASTPNQTPKKWLFDVSGDLSLARSVRGPADKPLDTWLAELLVSESTDARFTAVETLRGILDGQERRLHRAARTALERLADDDSKRVSAAAAAALGTNAPTVVAAPAKPAAPPVVAVVSKPSAPPVVAARPQQSTTPAEPRTTLVPPVAAPWRAVSSHPRPVTRPNVTTPSGRGARGVWLLLLWAVGLAALLLIAVVFA